MAEIKVVLMDVMLVGSMVPSKDEMMVVRLAVMLAIEWEGMWVYFGVVVKVCRWDIAEAASLVDHLDDLWDGNVEIELVH
jgi:hypothetical protein